MRLSEFNATKAKTTVNDQGAINLRVYIINTYRKLKCTQ